jgi:hypothetical protein
MKLLYAKTSNFKNVRDDFEISLVAKSKKTAEDREYELQEIAEDLFVYNTLAFIGKNASGKTTAVELLDCCYSILGDFRLEGKHYEYDNVQLDMIFFHDGYLYRYMTILQSDHTLANKAIFTDQHIYRKKYFKTKIKTIFEMEDYTEMEDFGELPEDTSKVFFVLKKKTTRAIYFDSFGEGVDTYAILFKALKNYNIPDEVFLNIIRIFDENVKTIEKIDDHNYKLYYQERIKTVSDQELVYLLSSGTTKGVLLYVLMVASLQNGFDLIVDEIENHFHKTLVENMISLYKDKSVNKNNATLIFTTHYCEVLDLFNRRDNIWIAKTDSQVYLSNMYDDYEIRTELLKSRQFYNNAFQTAVNYDELMNMKRKLMSKFKDEEV